MAAPPLVFEFVGAVFTAIFYSLYCLIFGLYWRIQLKRADRWRGVLFFYALIVNFILCTAYFIIVIILVQFYITMSVLKDDSLESSVNWMIIANNALYTAIDIISQLIMLYRCWIMWRQPLVMVIPCILSLAFLVTALTTLIFTIKTVADILPLPDWYFSAVTAFFFLSLGVNALVTALIVYRIVTIHNEIREFNTTSNNQASAHGDSDGRRDINLLISILIESGLITFVGQLAQSIMFRFAGNTFPLISGSVVMFYGISMIVVLVRVETGDSLDHNTIRRAVNSMDSGRSTPLKFQVNQTTGCTEVGRFDSFIEAHPESSYTQIDTGTSP